MWSQKKPNKLHIGLVAVAWFQIVEVLWHGRVGRDGGGGRSDDDDGYTSTDGFKPLAKKVVGRMGVR